MSRMIAVVFFLCVGLAIARQTESARQTFGTDWVHSAVGSWETSEKLFVEPKAQDFIVESFGRHKGEVADFGGNHVWEGSKHSAGQTLVAYYLGNVRDKKFGSELESWFASSPSGRDASSAKDSVATASSAQSRFAIEFSDLNQYTVEQFFKEIRPVLNGAKGELQVLSEPSGASITLDTADRGFTNKTTVEKAGDHDIVVRSKKRRCSSKITVPAGGSFTYHCP